MLGIETIDPLACRRHVERHFTVEHMVSGYEEMYGRVLADRASDQRSEQLLMGLPA
jgi:hypothetical protein